MITQMVNHMTVTAASRTPMANTRVNISILVRYPALQHSAALLNLSLIKFQQDMCTLILHLLITSRPTT
jgi:hypothetical protein